MVRLFIPLAKRASLSLELRKSTEMNKHELGDLPSRCAIDSNIILPSKWTGCIGLSDGQKVQGTAHALLGNVCDICPFVLTHDLCEALLKVEFAFACNGLRTIIISSTNPSVTTPTLRPALISYVTYYIIMTLVALALTLIAIIFYDTWNHKTPQ